MRKLILAAALLLVTLFPAPSAAQNIGYSPSTNGMSVPSIAYASLPAASANAGIIYYVPDGPTGASLALSDGTNWRLFARGVIAQTYTLLAGDGGLHTFSFTGMTAIPNIQFSVVDNTTTGLITSNLQGVTTTSATVRVNRGLLSALTGGTTTGITINLLVVPNN